MRRMDRRAVILVGVVLLAACGREPTRTRPQKPPPTGENAAAATGPVHVALHIPGMVERLKLL